MLRFRAGQLSIGISFWFLAVVALFCVSDRTAFFLYLIMPVAIHEAGHILAMLFCGIKIKAVTFTAFSIDIQKSAAGAGYGREILLAVSGVAANLLAALVLRLFAFQSMRTMFLAASNIAVALFNMIPIGNLDGGQLVRALCERLGGVETGYRVSRAASFLALVPLFAAGIYILLRGAHNVTLLITCLYLAGIVIKN